MYKEMTAKVQKSTENGGNEGEGNPHLQEVMVLLQNYRLARLQNKNVIRCVVFPNMLRRCNLRML